MVAPSSGGPEPSATYPVGGAYSARPTLLTVYSERVTSSHVDVCGHLRPQR